jgi:endonuclease/exonuclease/phosphatase (EEP) superfamily protein YafD
VVVVCATWTAVRLLGLERGWPVVQFMAFTPYVAVVAVVVAVAVLVLRRWVAGAVATVTAVALLLVVLPRAIPDTGKLPGGPTLRVLSANLLTGIGDEHAVLDLARRLNVDLLAMQEFTAGDETGLDAAGVRDVLPYRTTHPLAGVGGSALYSRYPLTGTGVRVHRSGFTQSQATVTVPGAPPIAVESVHPNAPAAPESMRHWARDLRDQPAATVHGPVRVLLGDFNATLDHAALRRLIGTGYRDAASVVGAGLRPTWPYDEKWYVPGVTLDRVLVDPRVGVRDVRVYPIPGGDHRAIYAELVLPRA